MSYEIVVLRWCYHEGLMLTSILQIPPAAIPALTKPAELR